MGLPVVVAVACKTPSKNGRLKKLTTSGKPRKQIFSTKNGRSASKPGPSGVATSFSGLGMKTCTILKVVSTNGVQTDCPWIMIWQWSARTSLAQPLQRYLLCLRAADSSSLYSAVAAFATLPWARSHFWPRMSRRTRTLNDDHGLLKKLFDL